MLILPNIIHTTDLLIKVGRIQYGTTCH
ncbi:unnamed protein product [Staurois parvus]|uniref:Uncharacterized protein n=1 Tax=Staurois parvus TaxID=386267 RepID=A0ABN9GIF0_9NEOB|nr:unnamed protein product [Staurois parvus]